MSRVVRALTIAGSDPGGGAGIEQDLKTFQALDVWGMAAITAVTIQDTRGVHGWHVIPPEVVERQIAVVAADIGIDAAKTGMLPDVETIQAVARAIADHPVPHLVVDPVLVATSGDALASGGVADALRAELMPSAALVTPNAAEARALTGIEVIDQDGQAEAARALVAAGASAALVTGGDLGTAMAVDVLWDGEELHTFTAPSEGPGPYHGTGCMLSAAITAGLAAGRSLTEAIDRAKALVSQGIRTAPALGRGARPVNPGVGAAG